MREKNTHILTETLREQGNTPHSGVPYGARPTPDCAGPGSVEALTP